MNYQREHRLRYQPLGLILAFTLFSIAISCVLIGYGHLTKLSETLKPAISASKLKPSDIQEEIENIDIREAYTLDIKRVAKKRQAVEEVERLKATGIPSFFTPQKYNGEIVFQIRSGVYATRDEAVAAQKELARFQLHSSIGRL